MVLLNSWITWLEKTHVTILFVNAFLGIWKTVTTVKYLSVLKQRTC